MNHQTALTETIGVMKNHASVRQYTSDPIPKEHLLEIILAGQSAASSHFVQAYSIIHVTDKEKKDKMAELSKNQHVSGCSDFFLFCADMKRLEYAGKKNGVTIEHDGVENFITAIVDVGLIAQNVITAAESLGYGGCYIGGVRNNPGPIGELAGLPDKVFPVFGLCLGVPAVRNEVKPRLPLEAILHENVYNEQQYPELLERYDQTMAEYYQRRSSNNKNINWTEGVADFLKNKRRVHMREYVASKGFHLP